MPPINVEVIVKKHRSLNSNPIITVVESYLKALKIPPNTVISKFSKEQHPILHCEVQAIIVDDVQDFIEEYIDFSLVQIKWYVYSLDEQGPVDDTEDDGSEEELHLSTHLTLPSADLFNLWENLYFDGNVKNDLLHYARTMMEFSDRGVDTNVVNCNRVILLHGPPGTGKTSLCKALAQKLAIRMQDRYSSGILVEINSHSLFSKWFSESGKLVTRMFSKIKQIVQHSDLLVCVLIDEVESLAHARNMCISGNEPSDSIRVVNAILTQIDQIKRYSNVLILTTSNMTEAIDLAFIDRADIKQYLGPPSIAAIYKIYYSCIQELFKAAIINPGKLLPQIDILVKEGFLDGDECTSKLVEVCRESIQLSGRSLRKVPFIAHALFLDENSRDLQDFLKAMLKAVYREKEERLRFNHIKCKAK